MLSERLTPAARMSPAEIEARYPKRTLDPGSEVTRVGPSPTGFMHIGGLYAAFISMRLAQQTRGVFFLRIEDTDKKREVAGATDVIVSSLSDFGIVPNEGEVSTGREVGAYGPYRQSERRDLYQSFARVLLDKGLAYPCFATPEELEQMRVQQTKLKKPPGYYGRWAIWRDRKIEEVNAALESGLPFVIRLRAAGGAKRIELHDLIRGTLTFPPNDQDIVLIKSDGLPTYHFAHVVDDHLMRTTAVIRGHEWLASYPIHAELFAALEWQEPRYAHISPIEKVVGSSRRKLSKRHDPEASVTYYQEQGYPHYALVEYMLTLADSRFEDWRRANPDADALTYEVDLSRMGRSGALFDLQKLDSISKERISHLTESEIYAAGLAWAKKYDRDFANALEKDAAYSTSVLGIERKGANVRKDIAKWADLPAEMSYFFDESFEASADARQELLRAIAIPPGKIAALFKKISEEYREDPDRDAWLHWLQDVAGQLGYAPSMKVFKAEPDRYTGHFGDVALLLRIALAARRSTPDLHQVMQVMGSERVKRRLEAAQKVL